MLRQINSNRQPQSTGQAHKRAGVTQRIYCSLVERIRWADAK